MFDLGPCVWYASVLHLTGQQCLTRSWQKNLMTDADWNPLLYCLWTTLPSLSFSISDIEFSFPITVVLLPHNQCQPHPPSSHLPTPPPSPFPLVEGMFFIDLISGKGKINTKREGRVEQIRHTASGGGSMVFNRDKKEWNEGNGGGA